MLCPTSGRFTTDPDRPALLRFVERCRFDPGTGCVIWIGAQTSGRGHSAPYGSFWFEQRRWFAHRWAAKFIHKLTIDDMQVDHCCPNIPYPDTLCVEHVQAITPHENRLLQTERRRMYALMTKGIEPPPRHEVVLGAEIPFFPMPAWLSEFNQCATLCEP